MTRRFRHFVRHSAADVAAAALLWLIAFAVYVTTLAPGLLMNDSAELQTLSATLGQTHPTGYPVYLLAGKLMTLLPLRDVAYRVNLLSAVMGATCVGELYALSRILTGRRWLAAVTALMLSVSPTFWSQAIIAEVYTSAAALTLAVLVCLARWQQTDRCRWLFLAGCLGGLSIGVHLTVALMAPAALLFLALQRCRWKANGLAALAGAAAGCAATFAAFAIVDWNRPASDYFKAVVEPSRSAWGLEAEDIDSLPERVWFSLRAVQYRSNLQGRSAAQTCKQFGEYLENLPNELPLLWLLAAFIGIVQMLRANWRFALLLILTLLAHLVYVATHDMGDIQVAYIPTYILLAVFAACALGRADTDRLNGDSVARLLRSASGAETLVVLVLLVATLLPMFGPDAWTDEGRRAVWLPETEPRFQVAYSAALQAQLAAVVNDLEEGSVLFTDWARLYAFYYVAHVEQRRTDLVFVQTYPALRQHRLARSALECIRLKVHTQPVYLSEPLAEAAVAFTLAPVTRGGMTLYRVGEVKTADGDVWEDAD